MARTNHVGARPAPSTPALVSPHPWSTTISCDTEDRPGVVIRWRRGRLVGSPAVPSTGDYLFIGAVAAVTTFLADAPRQLAGPADGVAVPPQRTHGAHRSRCRRSAGWRCSSGSSSPSPPARLLDRFDPFFACTRSRRASCRGRRHRVRRPPRRREGHAAAGQGHRLRVAALAGGWWGVTIYYFSFPFFDSRPLRRLGTARDGALAARHDAGDQPHRWARRSRCRHRRDRRRRVLPQQPEAQRPGAARPPNFGLLVAIMAVGMCVGFLPHNFNPARIIMGDSGAILLGLMMAVATSLVGGRADPSSRASSGRRTSSWPRS